MPGRYWWYYLRGHFARKRVLHILLIDNDLRHTRYCRCSIAKSCQVILEYRGKMQSAQVHVCDSWYNNDTRHTVTATAVVADVC